MTTPHAGAGRASLLDALPPELIIQVVDHLAFDRFTLCAFAQTCRLLQVECEKYIYNTIELFSTDDLRAIMDAFRSRPERIASVETLRILYRFHEDLGATSEERKIFNMCVSRMKALKDWHIESPFDNFKWNDGPGHEWVEQDMEQFRQALEAASWRKSSIANRGLLRQEDVGLAKLEKLVIHSHGASTDIWDLEGFHCLFRHPSLRYLHVSCFVLPETLPELEPYARSTPLTTLIFDECELEPNSLGSILRTTKALKHLTLGENVYNNGLDLSGVPRLSNNPEASLAALQAVAQSLETLSHNDPLWKILSDSYGRRPIRGDGMRNFHQLEFMDIDPCSFLHQCILSHTQAPPNLTKLRLHQARAKMTDSINVFPPNILETLPDYEPYTYVKSLKTLEFTQSVPAESWLARSAYICQENRLQERHQYAFKLYKCGIDMKVYLEAVWRDTLQPPYLQGEPKPRLVSVYDSTVVGFRRHIDELRGMEIPGSYPDQPSPTSSVTSPDDAEASDKQPPETDHLNTFDILQIRNELTRRLNRVWMDMDQEDDDEDDALAYVDTDEEMDDLGDLDDEFLDEWADMLDEVEDDDDGDDDDEDSDMDDLDDDEIGFIISSIHHIHEANEGSGGT